MKRLWEFIKAEVARETEPDGSRPTAFGLLLAILFGLALTALLLPLAWLARNAK